jgi:hypothetical protein
MRWAAAEAREQKDMDAMFATYVRTVWLGVADRRAQWRSNWEARIPTEAP